LDELIKRAASKFEWHIDPINLGVSFLKAGELKDYPKLLIKLEPKEWIEFFNDKALSLKNDIIS